MHESLRLHHERVRKGIGLDTISDKTALSLAVVTAIDTGQFEDLPPGVYARAYVRAFAAAVGVPADEALRGIEELLPQVEDPLPALRELAPPSPSESLRDFLATQAMPLQAAIANFTIRRVVASMIDATLLVVIGSVMVVLAAWICETQVAVLLEEAGAELALMFAVPVLLYFLLLEAVGHQTVGAAACGTAAPARIIFRIATFTTRPPRMGPVVDSRQHTGSTAIV